ncbi:MAG: hypothetical protein WAM14_11950 [Candidatus Nitrosopolaris sp.]
MPIKNSHISHHHQNQRCQKILTTLELPWITLTILGSTILITMYGFWIPQQVADTKYTSNIGPLLENAKEITHKRPNTFITDGAPRR